jgi:lysophospholipase
MEISDWIRIAEEIELNYHLFDAFVVLHGTDTMCYSSSALSFLLEDLGKTVVSQNLYTTFLDISFFLAA